MELVQMAVHIMSLDEQSCIVQAAEAEYRNNPLRAEYWRNLGGYGGLDGWTFPATQVAS